MPPKLKYITISSEDLREFIQAGIGREDIASVIHNAARSLRSQHDSTSTRRIVLLKNEFKRLRNESLGSEQVAELLGISRGRVRQLSAPEHPGLYAFRGLRQEWRYPPWQFFDGGVLPHLRELLKVVSPTAHPISVSRFMTQKNPELQTPRLGKPVSPREWFIAGYELEPILKMAGACPSVSAERSRA